MVPLVKHVSVWLVKVSLLLLGYPRPEIADVTDSIVDRNLCHIVIVASLGVRGFRTLLATWGYWVRASRGFLKADLSTCRLSMALLGRVYIDGRSTKDQAEYGDNEVDETHG